LDKLEPDPGSAQRVSATRLADHTKSVPFLFMIDE
jgi:hypothetical protein